jgi:ribosome-associated protein
VIFDIEHSPSLGPRQRDRLLLKLGPEVRVIASDERSQTRNRELALMRLRDRLAAALHIDKHRRPTKPTKGSQERRLETKRRNAERKQLRRGVEE